jgi:hypothetical protein
LIGLIILVAINIYVCILLSISIHPKNKLNNIAVMTSTFISSIIWHVIVYYFDDPQASKWFAITFPIVLGISFFISASTWFILFYVEDVD